MSKLAMLWRIAWRSLGRNRGRTFLTMLGIVIGVAAVIAIVALGNGMKDHMEAEMAAVGENSIEIEPVESVAAGVRRPRAALHINDAEDMKEACPAL
ncbi:MAG: ABC transporter permease, partial [Candidatus Xenobia bacterium]